MSAQRRDRPGTPLADRLSRRYVVTPSACWQWTGYLDTHGYGRLDVRLSDGRRQPQLAHRLMYELQVGTIPDGLVIDHLCRNRACVNPAHMEPVTHDENIARGIASPTKTQCVNGHSFTPENTYIRPSGWRQCRMCQRDREARYRARKAGRLVPTDWLDERPGVETWGGAG